MLLALGPGLLAMAGDNDAGGLLAYAATGARYGASLFVPLLLPLCACAYVCQDMALRIGAAGGRGLGDLVRRRFSRSWALLAGGDLALQDWLTLVTEFAGMGAGLAHFGVPTLVGVPLSCALVLVLCLGSPYRTAERLGVGLAVASLLFVPLAAAAWSHPAGPGPWAAHSPRGLPLYLLAAVGNALAPWMPFFQAEAAAEAAGGAGAGGPGGARRALRAGRADLLAGSAVQVLVAAAVVVIGAAGGLGRGLAGDLFAVGLFDAGLIAALTVSLSTAWAVLGLFGGPRGAAEAGPRGLRAFRAGYALAVVAAAGAAALPRLPLELVAVGVQGASAVLMPPILGLMLWLCNDAELMGPLRNGRLANAAAAVVLAAFTAACLWALVGP